MFLCRLLCYLQPWKDIYFGKIHFNTRTYWCSIWIWKSPTFSKHMGKKLFNLISSKEIISLDHYFSVKIREPKHKSLNIMFYLLTALQSRYIFSIYYFLLCLPFLLFSICQHLDWVIWNQLRLLKVRTLATFLVPLSCIHDIY